MCNLFCVPQTRGSEWKNLASQVQCGGFLRQLLYHLWGMSHAKLQLLLSFPSILVIVIILLNILFTPHVALLKPLPIPLTQSLLIDVPASRITSLHCSQHTHQTDTWRTKIMPLFKTPQWLPICCRVESKSCSSVLESPLLSGPLISWPLLLLTIFLLYQLSLVQFGTYLH